MELPDANRVAKALNYLANTDEEYGRLCAAVSACEHKGKAVEAMEYLKYQGPVKERESSVRAGPAYKEWYEELENLVADREIMRARRKTAELLIEVWRSVNASRRQGGQV